MSDKKKKYKNEPMFIVPNNQTMGEGNYVTTYRDFEEDGRLYAGSDMPKGNTILTFGFEESDKKDAIKKMQKTLKAKNLYNGEIDGIWGPKTDAAYGLHTKVKNIEDKIIDKFVEE